MNTAPSSLRNDLELIEVKRQFYDPLWTDARLVRPEHFNTWPLDIGMWFLTHRRKRALWWYNNVFMPLDVRFQKKLELVTGMIATNGVDEVLLVCRKRGLPKASQAT